MYVFEIFIFANERLIKLLSPRWNQPRDWKKILGLLADQMDGGMWMKRSFYNLFEWNKCFLL